MATKTFDAVVIGGGIIGVSSAYQLARRGLRVAILEKGPHVAAGSTGQSSAVVRQRYANFEVVSLAYNSLQMFQQWCDRLELTENQSGFTPAGVVWITGTTDEEAARSLEFFRRLGAAGEVAPVEELKQRYPGMNFCSRTLDLSGQSHECTEPQSMFFEPDAGYADPQGTTEDLLRAAQALGVELFVRHEVTSIETAAGGGFSAVHCANGSVFSCARLLNAAGPWCGRISQILGVTLPMNLQPTRVQMAVRDRPAELPGDLPVFVSPSDLVYGRPEAGGTQLIIGSVDPADERELVSDPDHYDTTCSADYRDKMMHKLHHRFAMKSRGTVHGYAALYTVNTDDWHPVIDAIGPEGYFVANGFSGHGFKLGPAVGAMIGRMMTGIELPEDPAVEASYFSANRKPISSSGGVLA